MTSTCCVESMTWGAFNKFANRIGTNLCAIRVLRSAELPNCQLNLVREQKRAQSANSRSVCMPAQVDNSEKLRAIWRLCIIIYYFVFPVWPKAWENGCGAWKRETCLVCGRYLHGKSHSHLTCLSWLESYGFQTTRPPLANSFPTNSTVYQLDQCTNSTVVTRLLSNTFVVQLDRCK